MVGRPQPRPEQEGVDHSLVAEDHLPREHAQQVARQERSDQDIGRIGDGTIPMTASTSCSKRSSTTASTSSSWGRAGASTSARTEEQCQVRDYGRGIPLGKVVECVSQINTGGKYNDDVFQFSVGLNGVGTKAVNALSSHFQVRASARASSRSRFSAGEAKQRRRAARTATQPTALSSNSARPRDLQEVPVEQETYRAPAAYYAYLNTGPHAVSSTANRISEKRTARSAKPRR